MTLAEAFARGTKPCMPSEQPWVVSCTHFLSQEEENRLREELRQEWEAKQEKIKSECSPVGPA